MVYKVRLTLLLVLLVVLVLGFMSLRHDLHIAKSEITSMAGPAPVGVWGYTISGLKHLYVSLSSGTAQYLSSSNTLAANMIKQA